MTEVHGNRPTALVGGAKRHQSLEKDVLVIEIDGLHRSRLMAAVGGTKHHQRPDDVARSLVRDLVTARIGRIKYPGKVETSFGSPMMKTEEHTICFGTLSVVASLNHALGTWFSYCTTQLC